MRNPTHLTTVLRSSWPVSFHYPSPYRDENADYTASLVQGEILLRRLVTAYNAGIHPAHRNLTLLHESLFWHRPDPWPEQHNLSEILRWHSKDDRVRDEPLRVAAVRETLIETYGMGERMVAMLMARQSHGLQVSEQLWLEQRRDMPILQRPLLRNEYSLLVDCVESAYLGQPVGRDRDANQGHAIAAAKLMGTLATSPKPPFQHSALGAAFTRAFFRPRMRIRINGFPRMAAVF